MRLSDEQFFLEKIDLSVPALKEASELFRSGNTKGAERRLAEFVREYFPNAKTKPTHRYVETLGDPDEMKFADMICEGYVCVLDYLHKFENGVIDWTHNPTYNGYVEFTYHLQYNNEFLVLAKAYEVTGDEKYAKRFEYMISSWIAQLECPDKSVPGRPAYWRTLEAGQRMNITWPYAINVFAHSPSIPDRTWVDIFKSVWEHGFRLIEGMTYNRAHNNWIITEMVALLNMGLSYPFMKDAEGWKKYAFDVLLTEVTHQVMPDGSHVELTTRYHNGMIASFRQVIDLLSRHGEPVPKEFEERIYLLFTFYPQIVRPDLYTPDLNDGYNTDIRIQMNRAITLWPENETFRFFATEGKEGTPPATSSAMPYAGFAIMRTDWSKNAIWAFLDAGPEGASHIHEDKLSLQLFAYGTNMLPDTGWYAYDGSDMRKYVLTTRAHNTGLVDGLPQNRIKTHQNVFTDKFEKADFSYNFTDDIDVCEGVYDQGYGDELVPVKHTRKVIFFKKGMGTLKPFLAVLDDFEANDGNEHCFEVSYQLPSVPVSAFTHTVKATYGTGATLSVTGDKYPKISIGQYAPEYMGWEPIHSNEEHEHAPAPCIVYTKRGTTAKFATVLYPSPDSNAPVIDISLTDDGFTLTESGVAHEYKYSDEIFKTESNIK